MEKLKVKKVGIDTYKENIAYMPRGCEICKSQGFDALSKIEIRYGKKSILATLNITENGLVSHKEIGLSKIAFERLGAPEQAQVSLAHPNPLLSTDYIRLKLEGKKLTKNQFLAILQDIIALRYSNIELTAFVAACSSQRLSEKETVYLTEAMIETGEVIDWGLPLVLDKHCIGGLPGNRTTMIVVPIVAALGLPIPKTSSRAITSPAGTADTMETLTNVSLSLQEMRMIVAQENACITWGGSLALAPSDDIIISVERPLNIDSEAQMIASILSKKKAAGATHVLLDIPVGPTAKVTSKKQALHLQKLFERIGKKIGMKIQTVCTDGRQPIGRGIGPVLEAQDVLKVLELKEDAPQDLRKKSLFLAGQLLELSGKFPKGSGQKAAQEILDSGQAYEKFMRIARAQGTIKTLERAPYLHVIQSPKRGKVFSIHNQKIAKVAKLAGAPQDPKAGVYLHAKVGKNIKKGEELFSIYAENIQELQFAVQYVESNPDIFRIQV